MVGGFLAVALYDGLQGVEGWPAETFGLGVVRAIPSFLFGMLIAGQSRLLVRIPKPTLGMVATVIALALESVMAAGHFLQLITVYLLATCALAADRRVEVTPGMRAVAPLGALTYSIYMLHHPIGWALVSVLGERLLHLSGSTLNAYVALVGLVVLPVAAVLSYVLFETPLRRLISGRGDAV